MADFNNPNAGKHYTYYTKMVNDKEVVVGYEFRDANGNTRYHEVDPEEYIYAKDGISSSQVSAKDGKSAGIAAEGMFLGAKKINHADGTISWDTTDSAVSVDKVRIDSNTQGSSEADVKSARVVEKTPYAPGITGSQEPKIRVYNYGGKLGQDRIDFFVETLDENGKYTNKPYFSYAGENTGIVNIDGQQYKIEHSEENGRVVTTLKSFDGKTVVTGDMSAPVWHTNESRLTSKSTINDNFEVRNSSTNVSNVTNTSTDTVAFIHNVGEDFAKWADAQMSSIQNASSWKYNPKTKDTFFFDNKGNCVAAGQYFGNGSTGRVVPSKDRVPTGLVNGSAINNDVINNANRGYNSAMSNGNPELANKINNNMEVATGISANGQETTNNGTMYNLKGQEIKNSANWRDDQKTAWNNYYQYKKSGGTDSNKIASLQQEVINSGITLQDKNGGVISYDSSGNRHVTYPSSTPSSSGQQQTNSTISSGGQQSIAPSQTERKIKVTSKSTGQTTTYTESQVKQMYENASNQKEADKYSKWMAAIDDHYSNK